MAQPRGVFDLQKGLAIQFYHPEKKAFVECSRQGILYASWDTILGASTLSLLCKLQTVRYLPIRMEVHVENALWGSNPPPNIRPHFNGYRLQPDIRGLDQFKTLVELVDGKVRRNTRIAMSVIMTYDMLSVLFADMLEAFVIDQTPQLLVNCIEASNDDGAQSTEGILPRGHRGRAGRSDNYHTPTQLSTAQILHDIDKSVKGYKNFNELIKRIVLESEGLVICDSPQGTLYVAWHILLKKFNLKLLQDLYDTKSPDIGKTTTMRVPVILHEPTKSCSFQKAAPVILEDFLGHQLVPRDASKIPAAFWRGDDKENITDDVTHTMQVHVSFGLVSSLLLESFYILAPAYHMLDAFEQ